MQLSGGGGNAAHVDLVAVATIAFEVHAWAQAHGGDTVGRFDALLKEVRDEDGRRVLLLPSMDLRLDIPELDPRRHRALARGNGERVQGHVNARYWSFALATDALLTVAVSRIEAEAGQWSAHIGRGPLRQYVNRFSIPDGGDSLTAGAAPVAAPYALAIADVLMPLQAEIHRLGGARRVAPNWDPNAVL